MNKAIKNEILGNMEFLMKELHREWGQSRTTKATISIKIEEAPEVKRIIQEKIAIQQVQLERGDISFKEGIRLSRENYVLLRLVCKIIDKENEMNEKGMDFEFAVSLDKEELKLFKEILGSNLPNKITKNPEERSEELGKEGFVNK
ncbi:hypothetical protein [Anaerobium acetethylicum]|uniref:Uncharacterized protein n=1 Tax=Anaerobium acetethylicum TaxID=1619234 RepID=A0A1D3TWJ6_9FIRM|nr:hypothetical protein [Anaerobium acetethylicum]SCP98623.1 hypothetical protein SAMN05421730_102338 [Anaerobium acetethylicum]